MKTKLTALFLASICMSTVAMAKPPETTPAPTPVTPSPEVARTPASLSTRQDLGNRYLNIANDLAEIRLRKGDICEFDAYQGEILSMLQKANNYFDKKKTTPALDKEMASSLGYRIFLKSSEFENLKSGTPSFFANLEFYGQALGVYGSMEQIILDNSGKGMVKVLKVAEDGAANWVSYPLSWTFIRNKKGSTLVIKHSASGSEKTRSYRIVESGKAGEFDGALVPGNRANKIDMYEADYNNIKYYSVIIDECEA